MPTSSPIGVFPLSKFPEIEHYKMTDHILLMWGVAAGRQRLRSLFICPRMHPVAERDEPTV